MADTGPVLGDSQGTEASRLILESDGITCPVTYRDNLIELKRRREDLKKKRTVQVANLQALRDGLKRLKSKSEIATQQNFINGCQISLTKTERLLVRNKELIEETKRKIAATRDMTWEQFFKEVSREVLDEATYLTICKEAGERFKRQFEIEDFDEPSA